MQCERTMFIQLTGETQLTESVCRPTSSRPGPRGCYCDAKRTRSAGSKVPSHRLFALDSVGADLRYLQPEVGIVRPRARSRRNVWAHVRQGEIDGTAEVIHPVLALDPVQRLDTFCQNLDLFHRELPTRRSPTAADLATRIDDHCMMPAGQDARLGG
jgi:hypothetical protein